MTQRRASRPHTATLVAFGACGHAAQPPRPRPVPNATTPPPVRVRYDLARHADRAERFFGSTQVLDLAGLDRARATRGGWRTGFSRARFVDAAALVSGGRQGRLIFGRVRAAGGDVRARFVGRAAVPGAIAVYLDGEGLAPITLPTDAWGSAEVVLPRARLGAGEHELLLRAAGSRSVEGMRGRVVAADVLQWLDARPTDKPFFLYVHTIDPHVPYRPPAAHLALYGDPSYRGRVDFSRDATLLENVKLGRLRLDERDKAHLQALYDGEITYTDVHFAAILDGLDRRGLSDDTMVVLTSDHGEEFWDHGSVGHGHSVCEELLHVPLFVRLPGEPARRLRDSVGLVDVMPTILEALGRPVPENLSGRSFLPSLRGAGYDAPQATVSGFMEHWRTVNVGRYKLVQRPEHPPVLYDLAEDPGENTNVADAHPLILGWLRGLLGASLDATRGASTPTPSARRPTHAAETTAIDPETAAQLRALGYVGD